MECKSGTVGVCRVCLREEAEVSLFEEKDDMKLYEKMMACSRVQITEEDGFPSSICTLCYTMLDTAYEFKVKCEDTDVKLHSWVQQQPVKLEIDELHDDYKIDDNYNEDDMDDGPQDFGDFFEMPVKEESVTEGNVGIIILEQTQNTAKKKKTKRKISKSDKVSKVKLEKKRRYPGESFTKRKLKKTTSTIASSILEGTCMWNGFNWRFVSQTANTHEESKVIKEAENIRKLLDQERAEKTARRLKKRQKKEKPSRTKELCDICGCEFKSRHHIKLHQKLKHSGQIPKNYKCPDPKCDKVFTIRLYLARHVKRCHSESKEFVCNDCGKQFAYVTSLNNHMKSHLGIVKWNYCPHCPQKYKTQKSVDIHIKSAHTGERPFVCTICESAFFSACYLKEHMRLHTGETPFKCPICQRGYAQLGNMKSHMKQHRTSELNEHLKATIRPNYLRLLRDC